MRTVIFIGLMAIAAALTKEKPEQAVDNFYVIVCFIAFGMDIMEFVKNMGEKK